MIFQMNSKQINHDHFIALKKQANKNENNIKWTTI